MHLCLVTDTIHQPTIGDSRTIHNSPSGAQSTMFNIGIIGAGWIAHKMAQALAPLQDIQVYAIASRGDHCYHAADGRPSCAMGRPLSVG